MSGLGGNTIFSLSKIEVRFPLFISIYSVNIYFISRSVGQATKGKNVKLQKSEFYGDFSDQLGSIQ